MQLLHSLFGPSLAYKPTQTTLLSNATWSISPKVDFNWSQLLLDIPVLDLSKMYNYSHRTLYLDAMEYNQAYNVESMGGKVLYPETAPI